MCHGVSHRKPPVSLTGLEEGAAPSKTKALPDAHNHINTSLCNAFSLAFICQWDQGLKVRSPKGTASEHMMVGNFAILSRPCQMMIKGFAAVLIS